MQVRSLDQARQLCIILREAKPQRVQLRQRQIVALREQLVRRDRLLQKPQRRGHTELGELVPREAHFRVALARRSSHGGHEQSLRVYVQELFDELNGDRWWL